MTSPECNVTLPESNLTAWERDVTPVNTHVPVLERNPAVPERRLATAKQDVTHQQVDPFSYVNCFLPAISIDFQKQSDVVMKNRIARPCEPDAGILRESFEHC